ncbi:MAG: RsiV family protein [Alphaproteobacteria bacterium]|nr:RsiV family protein [Alphaproteobacteria bacterium]
MIRFGTGIVVLLALAALPARAEMTVSPSLVKEGFFLAPDCKPTADPKAYNECVCEAHVRKAQIAGVPAEIAASVNAALALLPEKLAEESCLGKPTPAPSGEIKVNRASADYKVAYQTPTTLTVLVSYSTYGAGAEHPLDGTEGFTFELVGGQLVEPIARLKPEQMKKAEAFIARELLRKYRAVLHDEAKARSEPYLTENGCDSCTLFYGKDGWVVRFQIDSIAPYAVGEPEVTIPGEIIPSPETLMTQAKS